MGKGNKQKEQNQKAAEERAERAKERRKHSIEPQEFKDAKKRKHLNVSGNRGVDIHFTETSTSTSTEEVEEDPGIANATEMEPSEASNSTTGTTSDAENHTGGSVLEPSKDAETQTEEFEYMFYRPANQAPDREYVRCDDKVRFYMGLPSYQVLVATFNHVTPHVSRCTQALDPFQELVLVLMKLRLNVPFKELAYHFLVSVPTVSRIFFFSWMNAMDYRLRQLVHWPERENLCKTMPMCFTYAFGNKVTVIIDCFEVFIEKPTNLLATARTFSSYKHPTI